MSKAGIVQVTDDLRVSCDPELGYIYLYQGAQVPTQFTAGQSERLRAVLFNAESILETGIGTLGRGAPRD